MPTTLPTLKLATASVLLMFAAICLDTQGTDGFAVVPTLRVVVVHTSRQHSPCAQIHHHQQQQQQCRRHLQERRRRRLQMSSDWSSFAPLEDDDEDEIVFGKSIDRNTYAVEDDDSETKAAVGSSLQAPSIEWDAEPIRVPPGSQLELSEENVLGLLSACRSELGTLFGYQAENRGVGITGGVDYVDMDGPTIIIKLKGRFWHERATVLKRVANYLQQRIPEIVDVMVEDPYQLTNEANEDM